jgi:hypothetical protein
MLTAIALWCMLALLGLAIGMAGYAAFEGMSLTDSYVNTAMILFGMGPMGNLKTTAGKIFAGSYAIFSGLLLIVATGFVLAPISTACCIISTWRASSRIDANRPDFGIALDHVARFVSYPPGLQTGQMILSGRLLIQKDSDLPQGLVGASAPS